MIQRPRGTRDFGPKEMEARRDLERAFKDVAENFGFREISTPIFEHTELFTLKSGPNIIDEMYAFEDKGGRQIALRPELTAPAMRFFVNDLTNMPRPLKVYYFGQCFRYERPQSGRFREFYQFGAELIGAPTPESDAEIIGLAAALVARSGLGEYRIRVGHIGVLRSMLKDAGVPQDKVPGILQKLDKKVYEEARPLMKEAGMSEDRVGAIVEVTETTGPVSVLDEFPGEASDYLRSVFDILEAYGVTNVQVDLGVVRGLDYYTGIVFEIDAPKLGAEKQVCGGGSYSLTELFGGEKVFSTGFAIGFDRVMIALEKEGYQPKERSVVAYVIPVSENMRVAAHSITAELRKGGIAADVDLMRRNIGKNFKYADSIGARFAVIVGEKEMADGSVALRDLKSGEQILVKRTEIVDALRREESGVRGRCGGEN
ncbi:MAG: histidine--tRNA ligase [Methanomassiliicoccales archaeon]